MEYFFVTLQEVSDNKYVNSEHVLEVVKTVNDYYTANRGNDVPLALRITYKNYWAATERIRDVRVARCAAVKKKADEDIHELHKCEIKAQVARANREKGAQHPAADARRAEARELLAIALQLPVDDVNAHYERKDAERMLKQRSLIQ